LLLRRKGGKRVKLDCPCFLLTSFFFEEEERAYNVIMENQPVHLLKFELSVHLPS
jgi:hypothetical protein